MSDILDNYQTFLPPQLRSLNWRPHPLDGALLLFERDTGLNVKLEGEETTHLKRIAPRTLLIAVTNICNLQCHFCYRNLQSPSDWAYDSLLEFCQQASDWGVLEVAFGGGEPMLFPNWEQFIHKLYSTSQLAVNFTTNGMKLTPAFLHSIEGKYGNIRLSLYDTNHYEQTIELLVNHNARFGVNWLITPDELETIEAKFLRLFSLGVRDFLLLSYKGSDPTMHFQKQHYEAFSAFVQRMYDNLKGDVQIKLDVCWGDLLSDVPRLFETSDCSAGDGFLSITSDRHIKPCSFHHWTIPFETLTDVRQYWQSHRKNRQAAAIGGCARLPQRALNHTGRVNDEVIYLAGIQQQPQR
ncbi:radical SAM protein [Phototrophicus methaneseepsis]|uniref:Radical SAM protein n=1 Tax=Phototrophicus methaneseepsis TaxID=2710758 RepID=A0A7S8EBG4_9CHLR|nr:radical SAM protein [Phototrophicus methaneseepsis]QPC83693.1 radical SAM protein [Phototrophicus methaneseepsis]